MKATPATDMLENAAQALGPLAEELVFVGGAIVGLLLTDSAAPAARATKDVDVLVEATKLTEYYAVEERMRGLGFEQRTGETVICRWHGHGLVVDLMPVHGESVLGFTNPWYESTFRQAVSAGLPNGTRIRIADGPHLLATKLAAFFDRGLDDVYASHDLEDVVLLINGRSELPDETASSAPELRRYVAESMGRLLAHDSLVEAVEGHLGSTSDSSGRRQIVLSRMRQMGAL